MSLLSLTQPCSPYPQFPEELIKTRFRFLQMHSHLAFILLGCFDSRRFEPCAALPSPFTSECVVLSHFLSSLCPSLSLSLFVFISMCVPVHLSTWDCEYVHRSVSMYSLTSSLSLSLFFSSIPLHSSPSTFLCLSSCLYLCLCVCLH